MGRAIVGCTDCLVDVTLDCQDPNGQDCWDVSHPPTLSCTERGEIFSMEFRYQDRTCDQSTNRQIGVGACYDNTPIAEDPVDIKCFTGLFEPLNISSASVIPGESFFVSKEDGSSLSQTITCFIVGRDGRDLQVNTIDVSGKEPLFLGDKFGALELETCDDLTCVSEWRYSIELHNIGGSPADVTAVDFVFDDFHTSMSLGILGAGHSISRGEDFLVDICSGPRNLYSAFNTVEANPLNQPTGASCWDEDKLFIVLPCLPSMMLPPMPAPTLELAAGNLQLPDPELSAPTPPPTAPITVLPLRTQPPSSEADLQLPEPEPSVLQTPAPTSVDPPSSPSELQLPTAEQMVSPAPSREPSPAPSYPMDEDDSGISSSMLVIAIPVATFTLFCCCMIGCALYSERKRHA